MQTDLHKIIQASLNQKVTYSRAGGGAGSIWLITFENEVSIMTWCTWRIEQNGKVLATSTDDDDKPTETASA